MSKSRFFFVFMVLSMIGCFAKPVSAASWYGAPFSADIVIINPTDPKDRAMGKLYVGLDRFRAEGVYQGSQKVLIVNMTDRKALALSPEKKEFHEGMREALMPPRPDVERMPGDPQGPCKSDPQLECTQTGSEVINGIQTEKWRVNAKFEKGGFVVLLWIDPKRKIVIKQQPDKGPVMERKLLDVEKLDGRETEKWEFTHTLKDKDQEKKRSYLQWVDAALRIPVRMGEGRHANMEISKIHEGEQDAALFQVPSDYKEVKLPLSPAVQQELGSVPELPADRKKEVRFQ